MRKNINSGVMKHNNMIAILDIIREKGKISRKDIAREVGLTASSVTNIVNDLIAKKYVIETGVEKSVEGRKPIILQLNSDAAYIVGVELKVRHIYCVMVNISSHIVAQNIAVPCLEKGPDAVIEQIVNLLNDLIERSGIERGKILGIGVVSAGPFNWKEGVMLSPPNFKGWECVPIRNYIMEAMGIQTFFEKDSLSSAMAEYWFGCAREIPNIFVINVYEVGLGGGILINGEIYRAFEDGAGDVGHITVEMDGELCSCGNTGCLETVSTGFSLLKRMKTELRKHSRDFAEQIGMDEFVEMANSGDSLCVEVLRRGAKYLGMAISNIVNLFSPEIIVLGGTFIHSCPVYAEFAIQYARRARYPPYAQHIKMVTTELGEMQGALGGVATVFADFFKGHLLAVGTSKKN